MMLLFCPTEQQFRQIRKRQFERISYFNALATVHGVVFAVFVVRSTTTFSGR